jgi:transmembrane sensor
VNPSEIDWRLITVHFSGEATAEEEQALQRWLGTHPEHREWIHRLHEMWNAASGPIPSHDAEAGWERVRARALEPSVATPTAAQRLVDRGAGRRASTAQTFGLRAAALLLLLLLPTLFWMPPGGSLSDGTTAAVLVEVPRGAQRELELPDGSRVVLGPESSFRYAQRFGPDSREVHLEGMGYFEVATDPRRPFTVYARGSQTRVLGTAFSVRAYPEDSQVRVAVEHGKVALNAEGRAEEFAMALRPGEVGRLHPDGTTEVNTPGSLESEVGWARGRLALVDQPLADALVLVGRWYDVQLLVDDPALATRRITTTIENVPVADAIDLIALSVDAHYTNRGDTLVFRSAARTD